MYQWDFWWVWSYRHELMKGLLVTLRINVYILILGTAMGVLAGVLARQEQPVLRWLIKIYVDLFRTLPVLVLLVWFYFCVPILLGGVRLSESFSAIMVLSLNLGAFMAEIVRAGLEAVPRCYIEDGVAAGFSRLKLSTKITFPIALRIMLAPSVGQYINTVKLSVLASIIAVPELLHRTTDIISQVYRPLEFYTALAAIFVAVLLPLTVIATRLEAIAKNRYRWDR